MEILHEHNPDMATLDIDAGHEVAEQAAAPHPESQSAHRKEVSPGLRRLAALTSLGETELIRIAFMAERTQRRIKARSELMREGDPIARPLLILSGWAARMRTLSNGRRQLLSLLLPGDLVGIGRGHQPVALSTIVALTDVAICHLPRQEEVEPDSGLSAAYDLSRTLDDHYMLAQIMRLGRLTAYERIADFLLELYERLEPAGVARGGSFPMPLTQELMGDAMGLTSVHVNRTLQTLRREGVVTIGNGMATLRQPAALAEMVGHRVPIF